MLVIAKMMRVRTMDGRVYVHAIHGTAYISFVEAANKAYAMCVPEETAEGWLAILQSMSEQALELEPVG